MDEPLYTNRSHFLLAVVVSEQLRSQLVEEVPLSKVKVTLALGGVEEKRIVVYSFTNNPNQNITEIVPKGSLLSFTFLSGNEIASELNVEIERRRIISPTQVLIFCTNM
ncbi:hypothetical protein CR203_03650 [Salipaludibacillus neizhouensis]|uniref:Uncharacterized protein n=1 Tax=Salipaludibacillus neizhouensis TaxID=885475 RepID=A0A3A9KER3_9BACI|nr:hypothetical protein [Salipaludibacillus neizhouensis]RKL69140.1 hypothetical protein CR203_03650 [Salipaludibacillus neizhouensis]